MLNGSRRAVRNVTKRGSSAEIIPIEPKRIMPEREECNLHKIPLFKLLFNVKTKWL